MSLSKPKAERLIDTALIKLLLQEQYSDLIDLPIQFIDAGWDNVMYRLGDSLCLRLPRHQAAARLIEHEQTWLPKIAEHLTIPVPIPYRLGQPTVYYPWKWSILLWLAGVSGEREQPSADQGKIFGAFLRSLHQPAPINAPFNPVRGVPLKQIAANLEARISRVEPKIKSISPKIKNIWYRALDVPIDVSPKWLHGDLHPGNILIEDGEIVGVIDWGDITSGDIATDLAAVWMLFSDRNARQQAITEYGQISLATWQRAMGWAVYFGVTLLDIGLIDNPRQATIGERTLYCVAEDRFDSNTNNDSSK